MSQTPPADLEAQIAAAAERVRARRHALGLAEDAVRQRVNAELADLRRDLLIAEHALEHLEQLAAGRAGATAETAEARHG